MLLRPRTLLLPFLLVAPLAAAAAEPAADPEATPTEAQVPLDPLSGEALQANPRFRRVPGTRVHMLRPEGFVAAKKFVGLESLRGNARIVVTAEPTPVEGLDSAFSDEALLKQGMAVISREPSAMGSTAGELSVYRTLRKKGPARRIWTRYFGGRSRRFIITASSSAKRANELDEGIMLALRSARFRLRDPDFDPFEGLSFDIPGGREIAFAQRTRNQVTFSRDGRLPLGSPEDPAFAIMVAREQVSEGDRDQYCVNQLHEGKELDKLRIVAANRIERDGLPGCEGLANGTDAATGTVLSVYQAALFGSNELYLFKGRMGVRLQDPWLGRMRDMVMRFKRR